MIKKWTGRRATLIGILVLLTAGAATLVLQPRTDAAVCDDGPPHSPYGEWLLTPEAEVRTLNGDCTDPANAVCRQWCFVSCGEAAPQNMFDCFPE